MALWFLLKWDVLITSNSENRKVHKEVSGKSPQNVTIYVIVTQTYSL